MCSASGAALLSQLEDQQTFDVASLSRLRAAHPKDLLSAGIALVTARRKANGRLDDAEGLALEPRGVEQATASIVARHKARRFDGSPLVVDLCSGVGGDAMALAATAPTLAFDADPLMAWMTAHNAGIPAAAVDVTTLGLRGRTFHLDPSRRGPDGTRRWRYAEYQPGPAFIDALLADNPDGAIKLGPGVEPEVLPDGELEMISLRGRLVQAVLWTGRLARGARTATCLPAGLTLTGPPVDPPLDLPGRFLLAVDPAVERLRLEGVLCEQAGLASIHPQLGLLTSDRPEACRNPWITPFELLAQMPWRAKKVRRWLGEHDAGVVEVKTRGGAVDPQRARRELRGKGALAYTVFVLRRERKLVAYVTRRVSTESST